MRRKAKRLGFTKLFRVQCLLRLSPYRYFSHTNNYSFNYTFDYLRRLDIVPDGDDDWERLVTFYQFPREHWPHLRTTNVVESPFATVRIRTTAAKRFKKAENATALIWKILQVAESTFRRLKGAELLPAVYTGVRYKDGEPRPRHTTQMLAA